MEPVFSWRHEYELGNEAIDTDHRQLLDAINQLFVAMESEQAIEVYPQLRFITQYTQSHFAREEAAMLAAKYPDLQAHIAEHVAFTEKFRNMIECNPKVLIVKVSIFLHDWWVHHITVEDRKVFDFLRSREAEKPT